MKKSAKERERHHRRAAVAKALAHPVRVMMAEALGEKGEMCVCDLTSLAGLDMSTVSRHLSVMREAGLVGVEKRGLWQFYRLRCGCVNTFFDCLDAVTGGAARGSAGACAVKV